MQPGRCVVKRCPSSCCPGERGQVTGPASELSARSNTTVSFSAPAAPLVSSEQQPNSQDPVEPRGRDRSAPPSPRSTRSMSASDACRAHTAPSPTANGVGLFASTPIQPGTLIVSIDQPLLAIPDNAFLDQTCSSCLCWVPDPTTTGQSVQQWLTSGYEEPKSLKTCTGCKVVRYCDKVGAPAGCMLVCPFEQSIAQSLRRCASLAVLFPP